MADYRAAIDIGGTFTDICVVAEETGKLEVFKVPTAVDPIDGLIDGLAESGVEPEQMALLTHGTTVATNALITRGLPPAVMVTTRGFRDVIEIRKGTREFIWDVYRDPAPPYIRRRDRLEVSEATDARGNVVEPLDEEEARSLAGVIAKRGAAAVAVCFVNSYANPANETRMKEILEEELDGVFVCTSSEVLPELFEHDRFSTAVVNAVLAPLVGDYARRLRSRLSSAGYRSDVLLLHSGGGVMTTAMAEQLPVRLAASGLAAGAIATQHLAGACGLPHAIGLDMGGTSTDVSVVAEGEVQTTKRWFVEWGHPICFPSVDIRTIGAGGGSVIWIDEAGALRNGPQSAGSNPGPACYERGGELPTNTDANLVLGRLGDELIGGAMTLSREAARSAIEEHVAKPLGMSVEEAATAALRVANAHMADAVRLLSIRRGYDPRDFALVPFGGAGPLHAATLARELGVPLTVVPPNPGITSAFGALLVDIRHDLSQMLLGLAGELTDAELEAVFGELEAEARELLDEEGVPEDRMRLTRTIDMRYTGQWRSLTIPIGPGAVSLAEVVKHFHDEHEREYHYRRDEAPVEVYRLNIVARGIVPKPELEPASSGPEPQPRSERQVVFDEAIEWVRTPVFARPDLPRGAVVEGPAVIEQLDSTVIVPPWAKAEVDEWSNLRVSEKEEQR
jgi:N-methylhydantoinase A